MFFTTDLFQQIVSALRRQGFGDAGEISIRGICNIPLLGRKGRYIGVPSLITVRASVDDCFKRIQAGLIESSATHGRLPEKLVFQGGGGLPIPEWFRDWWRENNTELCFLDPEAILAENIDYGVFYGEERR